MANPFEVLGVSRVATADEIKSAFRKKAKDCHPDTHPDDASATAKFAELSDAYDKLKDGRAATYQEEPVHHHHGHHGAPPGFGDIFRHMDDMVRQQEAARRRSRGKNDDLGYNHTVTLEEAYSGTTATIELNHMRGYSKTTLNVPAGVTSGVKLRVKSAGLDTDPSLPAGDLIVFVHVVPHARFQSAGLDLIMLKDIDVFTALLGGEFQVETISGKTIAVTVPKLTDNGKQLRVAGHGMPIMGQVGRYGDLIIVLEVKMPTQLRQEQLDLIAKAKNLELPQ